MTQEIRDLRCPGCGSPAELGARECRHCGRPIIISTFNSISDWTAPQVSQYAQAYKTSLSGRSDPDVELALSICLLKLGLYDQALRHVVEAIDANVDNPDAYLYAALATLSGKRPFLLPMADIRRALQYLDAGRMIERRGIFDYLSAFVREDFFERKHLKVDPSSAAEYAAAEINGATQADIHFVHELLRVPAAA